MHKKQILNYLGKSLKQTMQNLPEDFFENLQEIRIRLNRIIIFKVLEKEYFLYKNGAVKDILYKENLYIPSMLDIKQMLEIMSDYSIYAFEEEIKNCFLTLKGGFRVGLVGTAVLENGKIKAIKNISSLNFRIAREFKGIADLILPYIKDKKFLSTIIISPPNCGKTTFLRDIVRQISDLGQDISLIDERGEIAGVFSGVNQFDVGMRTDVFDRVPKTEGMLNVLRTMSPSFIAVDEIGTKEDINAILKIFNSGVNLLCTVHSENIETFRQKVGFEEILKKQYFERFIVLDKFKISNVYNKNLEKIY